MKIGKFYKYIFYKIYRLAESMAAPWWSEWKASSVMDILNSFLLLSFAIYIRIFINRSLDLLPNVTVVVIVFSVIFSFNYYIFNYKDKWKDIVEEFDRLPKKKNKIGSWLVFLFVCVVFANLIYSFYLMSQIDWSQYR